MSGSSARGSIRHGRELAFPGQQCQTLAKRRRVPLTKTERSPRDPWRDAALKLACAEALKDSVPEAAAEVRALLSAAWRAALDGAAAADAALDQVTTRADIATALARLLPRHPPNTPDQIVLLLDEHADGERTLDVPLLLRTLARVLERQRRTRRRTLLRRVALGLLGIVMLGAGGGLYQYHTRRVWRATFYPVPTLEGTTVRESVRRVNFNWGRGSPHREIPHDRFSARFDTCLVIAKPIPVEFRVRVEDGARLFVDGKKVLNAWKGGKLQTVRAETLLDPGKHHLRVEYFNGTGAASLAVRAAFGGDRFRLLDERHLELPSDGAGKRCQ